MGVQGLGASPDMLTPEEAQLLLRIRVRKVQLRAAHARRKHVANNHATMPHGADTQRTLTTANMRVGAAAACKPRPCASHSWGHAGCVVCMDIACAPAQACMYCVY